MPFVRAGQCEPQQHPQTLKTREKHNFGKTLGKKSAKAHQILDPLSFLCRVFFWERSLNAQSFLDNHSLYEWSEKKTLPVWIFCGRMVLQCCVPESRL